MIADVLFRWQRGEFTVTGSGVLVLLLVGWFLLALFGRT